LKKNSWIIALLVALSITAFLFTGCVSPLKVEEDTETYEEYPLDKGYNAWAGQVYQKGWAIGGIKFQGKGDAIVIAKDLGYDIEMFQKATKLKIEMPDASYPRSGVDIIWGGEDESGDSTKGGGMWNQQPIAGGSGDIDTTFAKKDGNVLIIDLTKALKNYSAYTKAAKLKIVMQVNAPSYGDVEGLVQKAYLMIPNTPPPFVSVTKLELAETSKSMLWTNELELVAKITGENGKDATNQQITWAIKKWEPDGGTGIGLPSLNLEDPKNNSADPAIYATSSLAKYNAAKDKLFRNVRWQQEEYLVDPNVWPNERGLKDIIGTIIVPAEQSGKITVQAFIKGGVEKDGKSYDFPTKTENGVMKSGDGMELEIFVKDPVTFVYKIGGNPYGTVRYGAVDNGGVSGGTMDIITKDTDGNDLATVPVINSKPDGSAFPNGYTGYEILYSPTGGQYANSAHYVEVTFPTGKSLKDYSKFTCHYVSENCNLAGKSVRLKAMIKKPGRTYNPGPYIATISYDSSVPDGGNLDLEFTLWKDNANQADGTTNAGIYNKGVGADLSSASTDSTNAGRYVDKDADGNDVNIKNANKIYFWILPWGGVGTKFTISEMNFVP